MDLSPKLLTEVQFREQWRGYSPDEVDEFLERVAAGVEQLQLRLTEALERASNAERRLLERTDEDEIRRTLVLAQRTAVASMEEARAEADHLVSETDARCRQLVADAEAQAAQLDAEIATRRRTELGTLAEQRLALQRDVDVLREFVLAERDRIASLLRAQLDSVDQLAVGDVPEIAEVEVEVAAAPVAPVAPVEMRAGEPIEAEERSSLATDEPAPSPVDELRLAREELADALRRAGVEPDEGGVEEDTFGSVGRDLDERDDPGPARPALFDDRASEATGAYDVLASDEPDTDAAGVEEPEPRWRDDAGHDDDPFLAELRRAVVDTEPLGPRDEVGPAPNAGDPGDDDDLSSGGFFRRGRRRD